MSEKRKRLTVPTWLVVLTVLAAVLIVPYIAAVQIGLFEELPTVSASDVRPLPPAAALLLEDDDCYHGCSRTLAFSGGDDAVAMLDSIARHYRSLGWPLEPVPLNSPPALADHEWHGYERIDGDSYFVSLKKAGEIGAMYPAPPVKEGALYVEVSILRD